MANDIKPVHLLLLEPSSNDAETMITTLRNHGYPVRATQVVKEEDLQEQLSRQSWDLCLTRAKVNDLTTGRVIELIDEYGRDVPVILITGEDSEEQLIAALKSGVKDLVPFKSQERLFLVARRELENLDQRKLRKKAELQLSETEKRCSLLLDSSQDAIAYIHDGMHIYANQAYVDLFDFEDQDELLCMPVMDMIESSCHDDFKQFLRQYAKNPSNNTFACMGLKSDGSDFEAIMTVSNATYDNEACTQVLIKTSNDNAELEAKVKELSAQDVLTGLYNQTYFQERLDEVISTGSQSGQGRHLLFIELDQFETIEKEFGITGTDDIITGVANWLEQNTDEETLLARYGNEAFMAMVDNESPSAVKTFAEKLCHDVKDHLFEIEGKTQKLTFSIGITPVGDQANSGKELIANAHAACVRAFKKGGDNVKAFNKTIDTSSGENSEMIEKIHDAIENGKLSLLFQPIVKLHGDERPLYQSLLRMQTEDATLTPEEIFPVAESAGLASKLDRWVLMQSLKQLHKSKVKASLFVYLSASALTDEGMVNFIGELFKSTKMPKTSLVITVKAQDALTYLKRVILMSQSLKKIGVPFAISHLHENDEHFTLMDQLLPDYAISDGDVTMKLAEGGDALSNITRVCQEAHQRDILTVVPKVEDAASLAALWPLGVGYIQGLYLQAPMDGLNFDFSSTEF
ncbi:EAL domain-containing response regulator [Pleionea sediminis]|uniref:EAL domain-containing response regulator n=1 Tax=Pleionea sediminis TaxID=2569479 RepID=UPI001184E80A|nr:EAL domain-containing protein [Pleionea sediminis]